MLFKGSLIELFASIFIKKVIYLENTKKNKCYAIEKL